jgi:hypothetical protein
VRQALRDWRVWALTFTIQVPGVRALVRYAPWPAFLLPATIAISILLYGACLHGPLVPWVRRWGSRPRLMAATLCVIAAVNVFAYPKADALKLRGRGSDEDNALLEIAERLATGERPIYVATYLGNAPSAGLGWAALVAPLAVTRTYALLTPLSLCVLAWIVRRAGGGESGTALALFLPLTSPGFWELSVTGSDLFAIGVLFTALSACAWGSRRWRLGASVCVTVLAVAAATTRVVFAGVSACLAIFMWRQNRSAAVLVAAATAAVVAAEAWFWWPDQGGVTPLYLISKLVRLLGEAGVALAVVAAISSAVWASTQLDEAIATWWRGMWCLLVVPLAVVSFGVLAALGGGVADWQAAGYVEVAVAPLAAYVAMSSRAS